MPFSLILQLGFVMPALEFSGVYALEKCLFLPKVLLVKSSL